MREDNPYNSARVLEMAREMKVNWSEKWLCSAFGCVMREYRASHQLTTEEVCSQVNEKIREMGIKTEREIDQEDYVLQEGGYECLTEHLGIVPYVFRMEREGNSFQEGNVENSIRSMILDADDYLHLEHPRHSVEV